MKDQDVITRLVELHDHIHAPATTAGEDALRGERLTRRRRTVSAAAIAAAVVLTAGLVQVSWPNDSNEVQPAPAPSSPTPSDPADTLPVDDESFASQFNTIVAQVPDWSIADIQERFGSVPCAGDWSADAGGFGGGNFDVRTTGGSGQVWHDVIGFRSAAKASAAVDRLVDNLASCTTTAWQTQSIAQTGAMLASSPQGLMWVQQSGKELSTLNAVTNDGPPPPAIQAEIADLMRAYLKRRDD